MHVIVCMCVNFGDNFFKGDGGGGGGGGWGAKRECKTRENFNFFEKG